VIFVFKKVETEQDEDGNVVPKAKGAVGTMSDLLADSKVWQYAGVGFGDYDTMLMQKSMTKLLASSGASQMRFWGKIKGTEFDYFIVEGKLDAGGGDDGGDGEEGAGGAQEAGFEARGNGANEFVYWVCNSLLEHWVKLADIKPSQIK
jgi:hypothetical protein